MCDCCHKPHNEEYLINFKGVTRHYCESCYSSIKDYLVKKQHLNYEDKGKINLTRK